MKCLQPCATDPLSLAQLTPPALLQGKGSALRKVGTLPYARMKCCLIQGRDLSIRKAEEVGYAGQGSALYKAEKVGYVRLRDSETHGCKGVFIYKGIFRWK